MILDDVRTPEAAAAILARAFVGDGDEQLRAELLDRLLIGTLPVLLCERLDRLIVDGARAFVQREVLHATAAGPDTPLLDACRRLADANADQAMLIGILLDALEAADVCTAARELPLQEFRAKTAAIAAIAAAIQALTRRDGPCVH